MVIGLGYLRALSETTLRFLFSMLYAKTQRLAHWDIRGLLSD
jgi:hypothetical protein